MTRCWGTVMMMIRSLRSSILLIFLAGFLVYSDSAIGQIQDFQSRFGASIRSEVFSGFDLSLNFEQRFYDNSLRYDRSLVTLGGEYGLGKGFDVSAGARWILVQDARMELNNRFRLNADLSYRYNINYFSIRYRTRFQYGFDDQVLQETFGNAKLANRNRLEIAYHIFGTRFSVFSGGEIYLHINHPTGMFFYRSKLYGGIDYTINLRNEIEVSFTYDNEFNLAEPYDASILGVSYSYRF